ncbi:MAG: peptidoglycan editing factor PgeF [Deltaproteobacteria bacterium]
MTALPGLTLRRETGRFTVPGLEAMGVRASWTTREHDMAFEAPGRLSALRRLGIDTARLVCPSQVHGARVAAVAQEERGRGVRHRRTALPETDALITATPGTALSVLTADCLPVFLAAAGGGAGRDRRAIGLIHAGWRGLARRIVARTVRRLAQEYGVRSGSLVAVLGAAIRPCCYEVGEEFPKRFPRSVLRRGKGVFLDLAAEAALQLRTSGVPYNRIFDSRLCTCCSSDLLFSYRRDGQAAGRSMAILEIAGHGLPFAE